MLVVRETGSPAAVAAIWLAALFAPALLVPLVVARIESVPTRFSVPGLLVAEAGVFAVLALVTPHFSLALVLALTPLDGVAALAARALSRRRSWPPPSRPAFCGKATRCS